MPDIFDTFQKAAFGGVEFPYVSIAIKGGLRHVKHEYLHRPGWEIEKLGRWGYEFRVGCQFHTDMPSWPDMYPSRLSTLITLCEGEKTLPLWVPNLQREVQVVAVEWPRELLATVRSGEKVDFTFLEDSSERYTAANLIGTVSNSMPSQLATTTFEVEKLNDPEAFDLLDALIAEMDKWLGAIESIEQIADYQQARVDGLFAKCGALARCPILQTAAAAPALLATLALWGNIATLRNHSLTAKPLVAYVTERDRMSVVDVSMVLYGTPANALEIMQLNDLDDPMSIKVGTSIRYLAAA